MSEVPRGSKAGAPAASESVEGLSSTEAARLLAEVGPNEIPEERRSLLLEIGSRFWGPIPWMIEAALVLTAAVRRWADFAIIAVLLVMNGVVGFWEEHQAGNAIAALKEQLAVQGAGASGRQLADAGGAAARARRSRSRRAGADRPGRRRRRRGCVRGRPVGADGRVAAGRQAAPATSCTPARSLARGEASALVAETGAADAVRSAARSWRARSRRRATSSGRCSQIGRYLIVLALALVAVIVAVSLATRQRCLDDARVRAGGDDRLGAGRAAGGAVGDDGDRRAHARAQAGGRQPSAGGRGARGRRCALRRQDRHDHPEHAHPRRAGGARPRTPTRRR